MKIAILTNFKDLNPWYSLVSIVLDQIVMLKRYGHTPVLFTSEQFEDTLTGLYECEVKSVIPAFEPFDYATIREFSEEHKRYSEGLAEILVRELELFDIVFSHDWLSPSINLPLAEAVRIAIQHLPRTKFLHWVHSIPTNPCDWWNIRRYGGKNARLVYPNKTDSTKLAQAFDASPGYVKVIPHIVDARTYFEFQSETWQIIDTYPGLLESSFSQVYPAAADRLSDKGVEKLLKTFIALKQRGFSVCLLVVDGWTRKRERADIEHYKSMALNNGLSEKDFGFTSEIDPAFSHGLPRRILRELSLVANLFVYPSMGESFGLPSREAALTGVLPVNNGSLSMMYEVGFGDGLYAEFGSCENKAQYRSEREFYTDLSNLIISVATSDQTFQNKINVRQQLNMDVLYREKYSPLMTEMLV